MDAVKQRRKRTRSYSVAEAERMSMKMPLERNYSFVQAAYAAAQWIQPDPAFWVERAALAGMLVDVRNGRLRQHCPGGWTEEAQFLSIWLHRFPRARDAVTTLLEGRQAAAH